MENRRSLHFGRADDAEEVPPHAWEDGGLPVLRSVCRSSLMTRPFPLPFSSRLVYALPNNRMLFERELGGAGLRGREESADRRT